MFSWQPGTPNVTSIRYPNHFANQQILPLTRIKDERLYGEVRRALDILDFHLDRNDWLVGGKCTYADLAFVVWNTRIPLIMNESSEGWDPDDYLGFVFWQKSMMERESVKHALSVMADEEVKSEGKKDLVELLGQVSQ